MDFLEGEVKVGEDGNDWFWDGRAMGLEFMEEYEKNLDLAFCFSGVSFLSGEGVWLESGYVLGESD